MKYADNIAERLDIMIKDYHSNGPGVVRKSDYLFILRILKNLVLEGGSDEQERPTNRDTVE